MATLEQIDNKIHELEKQFLEVKGTETEVYTRIVGYHRAVDNWNKGKREEYKDRVTFVINEKKIHNKIDMDIVTHAEKEERKKQELENELHIEDSQDNESGDIASYILFQSQFCRNCKPVKDFITDLSIPGESIDVTTDLGMNSVKEYNVMSTPTVIFFDDKKKVLNTVHSLQELKQIFTEKDKAIC